MPIFNQLEMIEMWINCQNIYCQPSIDEHFKCLSRCPSNVIWGYWLTLNSPHDLSSLYNFKWLYIDQTKKLIISDLCTSFKVNVGEVCISTLKEAMFYWENNKDIKQCSQDGLEGKNKILDGGTFSKSFSSCGGAAMDEIGTTFDPYH